MTTKKILYLDIDGVLADFDYAIKSLNPEIEMFRGVERRNEVHRICRENPLFFENLALLDSAKNAVQILSEKFDVYFLSTPMADVSHSYFCKRLWPKKHFGEWAQKRLILTHRKDLLSGEFLVDDRRKHGSDFFKGQFIHFGQAPFENREKVLASLNQKTGN